MKRLIPLLLLLLAAPCFAQSRSNPLGGDIRASSTNCSVAQSCVWMQLPSTATNLTVTVDGTFSATLVAEESADGGVTWATVTAPVAGTNTYAVSSFTDFRVRASAYTSGAANITLQSSFSGSGATGSLTLPATLSAAGVFTNTYATSLEILINSAPDISSPSFVSTFVQGNQVSEFETISGLVPATSTQLQTDNLGLYFVNSGSTTNAVGLYTRGVCGIAGCKIWGENPNMEDDGFAAGQMYGSEIDMNVTNSGSAGNGIRMVIAGTAQPTKNASGSGNMPAIDIRSIGNQWTSGLACEPHATDDGTALGDCVDLGPNSTSGASSSQSLVFHSRNSGGTILNGTMQQGVDANGQAFLLYTSQSNARGYLRSFELSVAAQTLTAAPSCSASLEGQIIGVTDSTTVTFNATVTGGGTNHVLAYCNGTNWVVGG